jgi:hypothetical protein
MEKYIEKLAITFGLVEKSNGPTTPMTLKAFLQPALHDSEVIDVRKFQSLVGSLSFLRHVRPDLSYTINQVSQVASKPSEVAWDEIKRSIRYAYKNKALGLHFKRNDSLNILAQSDATWGSCPVTHSSVGGHHILMNGTPVLFQTKKQKTKADSSTYSELIEVSNTTRSLVYVVNILRDLRVITDANEYLPVKLETDNTGVQYLSVRNIAGRKSRHFENNYMYYKQYQGSLMSLQRVSTDENIADLYTKSLAGPLFRRFRDSIMEDLQGLTLFSDSKV